MIQSFREWLNEQGLNEGEDLKTLHYNLIHDGGTSLSYIGSLHYDKSHDFFAFNLPKSKFDYFAKFGYPLLLGTSRKSLFGGDIKDRLLPTLETTLLAVKKNIMFVRVHDVKENYEIIKHYEKQHNN